MKKRYLFLLGMLLGFVLGVLIAVGIYFLTVGQVAWKEYIETKLVPNVLLAFTSIGTVIVAALPVVKKVFTASGMFERATSDIKDTIKEAKMSEDKVSALSESLSKEVASYTDRLSKIEEREAKLMDSIEKVQETLRVAFCNSDELVRKGVAKRIAGGSDEPKS